MAKLTMNVPNRASGDPIELPGYGLFPNGYVFDIETLQADLEVGNTRDEEGNELPFEEFAPDKLENWRDGQRISKSNEEVEAEANAPAQEAPVETPEAVVDPPVSTETTGADLTSQGEATTTTDETTTDSTEEATS